MVLGMTNPLNPLYLFVYDITSTEKEIKEGQWIYVEQHHVHIFKHLYSDAGFNLFCTGPANDRKVVGFGLKPERATLLDLILQMLAEFNAPAAEEKLIPVGDYIKMLEAVNAPTLDLVKKSGKLKHVTLSYEQFQVGGGGKFAENKVSCLNWERIALIQKLSIKESLRQLIIWQNDLIEVLKKK